MLMSIQITRFVRTLVWLCVLSSTGCGVERNERQPDRVDESILTEHVFGLWVTRWDFQSQEDVRTIVQDAASMGITDLYWQVRGQGDRYYRSSLEPWGEELTRPRGDGGDLEQSRHRSLDPGFDPLALAIAQAHRRGVRVHAWINVMPLWRGKEPPIDPTHPFYTHPKWRLVDEAGHPQPLGDGYIVVNPVLDEVQDHIVMVVGDLVTRYNLDGVHLDYIRFLSDELDKDKLYPGDAQSLSLYAKMVGDRATPAQINRTKYRAWIMDRITHLIDRIGRESLAGHPNIRYSAAVWRRPDLARDRYLQDAVRWVNDGLVDEIMPMIYTDKDAQFEGDLGAWYTRVDRKHVIAGIGVYKHTKPSQTLSQVTLGDPRRFALFAYSSIFESSNPDQKKDPSSIRSRAAMRHAFGEFIDRIGI